MRACFISRVDHQETLPYLVKALPAEVSDNEDDDGDDDDNAGASSVKKPALPPSQLANITAVKQKPLKHVTAAGATNSIRSRVKT